jgi:hypothetical protein
MQNKHLPGLFRHVSGLDNMTASTPRFVTDLRNASPLVIQSVYPRTRFAPLEMQAAGGFVGGIAIRAVETRTVNYSRREWPVYAFADVHAVDSQGASRVAIRRRVTARNLTSIHEYGASRIRRDRLRQTAFENIPSEATIYRLP